MNIDPKFLIAPGPDLTYEISSVGDMLVWYRQQWGMRTGHWWNISYETEKKIKAYCEDRPPTKIYRGPHWELIKSPGHIIIKGWSDDGWFQNEDLKDEYIEVYEQYRIFNLLKGD